MSDERKIVQEIAVQRKAILPGLDTNTGGHQLQFSNHWYRAIYYGTSNSAWLSETAAIREVRERQTGGIRENKAAKSQEYRQTSFFDQGEFKDV